MRDMGSSKWRDLDSNRGHHAFQSCGVAAESARCAGVFVDIAVLDGVQVFPHFAVVCQMKRPTAGSVGIFVVTPHSLRGVALGPAVAALQFHPRAGARTASLSPSDPTTVAVPSFS